MKNITAIFEVYREAARHLRNTYYLPTDRNDWDTIEDFRDVSALLFKHLVLIKLQIELDNINWLAYKFCIEATADDLPILINREGESGYWDNPITKVKKGELEMYLIDYFDWNPMAQIDFRYFRVRIIGSKKYPELIGFDALIETINANVYYNKG
jgi:hypothetical protein